jgi:ADP-dependent NAD(P)H-hydrate dehydratase / NAD(P)H-hydrate epimerase
MLRAHAVADVRAAEHALMERLPPGTLMHRAAFGLATVCARLLGQAAGARVVLLVGGGDNGGDTLHAGALLARRGARVRAVLLDAHRAHAGGLAALRAKGGSVASEDAAAAEIDRADLVLDGIVGIGGHPGLRPPAARLAERAAASAATVVAVDLPSGVDVDSGSASLPHVRADVTVTFGTHKVCHLVDPASEAAGTVHLVDIGLDAWLPAPAVEALEPADVAAALPVPGRNADKYSRGVLGVRVGATEYAGASVLATLAASRSGVGMVRVVGQDDVARLVRSRCPEAVLAAGRVQAWLAGPGMDPDEAVTVVPPLLAAGVPTVLDAGALAALTGPVRGDVLITPHAGELARMLGATRDEVESDRLGAARRAAAASGATVLLKGSTTLVVEPHGRVRANRTGTPWLATAGSGDVLAGLAAALLAAGLSPLAAGSVAAHVHGMAGLLAAARAGSPTAQDVLAALPDALLAARTRATR